MLNIDDLTDDELDDLIMKTYDDGDKNLACRYYASYRGRKDVVDEAKRMLTDETKNK